MLLRIFHNTVKNILRSKVFWFALAILILTVFRNESAGHYGGDTAENYVLSYKNYLQTFTNVFCSSLLMYAMPIFTVITVVPVINRNHDDHFFEIEKAANIKSSSYLWGRIAALTAINGITLLILGFLAFQFYVFSRGGVDGLAMGEYVADMLPRFLRTYFFVALPSILFYIGVTYLIGSVFKSGIASAISGIGYAIFFFVSYLMFRGRIADVYFNYLSPIPYNLRRYFHYYDSIWFEELAVERYSLTVVDPILCISFLVGVPLLCLAAAYWKQTKRDT